MYDSIALQLESARFWRRAATRWLYLLNRCHNKELQESIRRRKDFCIKMSKEK
ncbi:PerC family transcriptional regulator [Enterobacter sp. BIDMC 26]|uniref:PerC family transcriptional regulator n=1 Tax=Enterobacter sp. BIDMC 26 TaxID=1329838 RepID=UPI00350FDF07